MSAATAPKILSRQLRSGAHIPVVGLGVYQSEPGAETKQAVLSALKLGYRHIDTAQFYNNEKDVGDAIAESGIARSDVFVTTKLWLAEYGYDKAIAAVKHSHALLGGDAPIDLLLMHAPGSDRQVRADTWRALEDLQHQGVVRDIGVSNFGEAHLKQLATTWRAKPAVNQVELHPWLTRADLVTYCEKEGIVVQAYSPLAKARKLDDAVLLQVAKEVGAEPAQVLVAWSLAKGFVTLPKSVHEKRQLSNLDAAKVKLTADQVARLDALDEYLITGWDPIKEHTP